MRALLKVALAALALASLSACIIEDGGGGGGGYRGGYDRGWHDH